MPDSHEPTNPTAINTKMTVEATPNPNKPQTPTQLAQRLANTYAPDLVPLDSIPGLIDKSSQESDVQSPRRISRRSMLLGTAGIIGGLAAGGALALGSRPASSAETSASSKSEAERDYESVKEALALVFNSKNGPIIHPNIKRFEKPDGTTPQGDPRWTIDANLVNPEFTPANKQQPPKLNVVLKKDSILFNTNVAQLFPELRDPEAVKGEDLTRVLKTLINKPEDYQIKVSERKGSGDDGAGDDMTAVAKADRKIEGKSINVTINSVGGLTMTVPKDLIPAR